VVDAIVLAAGAGRRVGGPKALLTREGRTYLECVIETCRGGGCGRVWGVTRVDAPGIERELLRLGARPVLNPDPERGMFSSVVAALERIFAEADPATGFLLFPVDHPAVLPQTVASLLDAHCRQPGAGWIRPLHGGRGGHPIVVSRETARALAALDPDRRLRDALREGGATAASVTVADPGVLRNVNLPGDLAEP
jgi:CTP:molybdopterin cytidylyltransferase MocA